MTGYNVAHGDTNAVQMNLNNDQGLYSAYMGIIDNATWWDEDDNTWNDVDKAAAELKEFVTEVRANTPPGGQVGEIHDADLDSVDWEEIVTDVLTEENLAEGRNAEDGF